MRPSSDETSRRQVRCPACGGDSLFAPENRFRPFCCQRCRQLDLGAWATESFRVAAPTDEETAATPASDTH